MNDDRDEGEKCGRCGRRYAVVWAALIDLWNTVEGGSSGMRCPDCFDLDCNDRGIYPFFVCFPEHVNLETLEGHGSKLSSQREEQVG